MYPLIFQWGDAALTTYSFLVSLAFFVGLGVWIWQGKRFGLKAEALVNLSLLAFFLGWLGARLLFMAVAWEDFFEGTLSPFHIWQGGVVYLGGFGAAFLGLYFLMPRLGVNRYHGFVSAAPALCFAHALGRLGCFFNGCCHGSTCHLPWAITYTDPLSAAPLGMALHPSQLYEVIGLTFLGLVLVWNNQKGILRIASYKVYLLCYGTLRFFVEYTRGDLLRGALGPFSTSQWLSLSLILAALFLDFPRPNDHNRAHES